MTQPIDRLFERLSMTYGIAWDNSLGTAPLNEIKSFWMHGLSGFLQNKESMMAISWALNHLPERPPNLVQFKNLCYQAPAVERPQLPSPPADPERVKQELAKFSGFRMGPKVDPKVAPRLDPLNNQNPSPGCMRVSIPLKGRVVSAHSLNTDTVFPDVPMSCTRVSIVGTATLHES